ncbi:alpha/beta hydrolase [Chelatococcus sambhunathii]|uniref:Alpha/beta hydrolase n=1 Tax=Chelatococcus sambhunathii TaxID=363953 RepID=A0ABU1DIR7_9HYPH|nr:alpha/beta hydrolase [Chelatococcus sambhunathii]MDR4308002.1 alpha/beta hydrolase [Chelatococcus sambhunathii]
MTATADPAPQEVWETLSQAERDAAYNNSAAIGGNEGWAARRDELAAPYRAARPAHLDLAYGPKPRMKVDLYPAADPAAPCLVYIHGGYWQWNSREPFAHYAEGLEQAGWSVALPSYTLAPEASLTEIVAELGEALDWIAREGPQHGVAGPIVLSGWSAGGHLTAMLLGHSSVVAGLAVSGVYELGPIRDTFLNAALKLSDDEIARLSPLRLPVVDKPLAIAFGTKELPALIRDSRALHAMRTEAGAAGPLIPVEGADHFSIMDGFRTADGAMSRAAIAILAEAKSRAEAA